MMRLVREGQERLAARSHPDPYIAPYMPGGTLFMRNPSFPNEALYPDGVPAHVSKYVLKYIFFIFSKFCLQ